MKARNQTMSSMKSYLHWVDGYEKLKDWMNVPTQRWLLGKGCCWGMYINQAEIWGIENDFACRRKETHTDIDSHIQDSHIHRFSHTRFSSHIQTQILKLLIWLIISEILKTSWLRAAALSECLVKQVKNLRQALHQWQTTLCLCHGSLWIFLTSLTGHTK